MIKKRFISMLVLLMVAVTGAWAETTIVTWTSSGSYENNNSRGGVTLSGDVVEYIWDELTGGEWRLAYDSNQGTFMTSLGNFTSIVISGGYINGFSGTGWNGKTWTGNASSVPFRGFLTDANGEEPWTITFTIAPATVAVTGVTLAPTSATLTLGETETVTLIPTVLPAEATDKSVTWSSSDEAVATVTDGVVTAVAAGTATITVTTTDGAKTATCAVTVAAPAPSTYTVTLKEGTEDADNWTITPEEAKTTGVAEGTEVTATYSGTKLVKSVKAVKKAASAEPEPAAPTLAQTMTTADMTVKVKYIHSDEENYCQFLSKGDGTYTFQSGDGWVGGDGSCAKALVVEGGKLVFKQNTYSDIDYDWNFCGFSVTFDTINNTYSEWRGLYAANEETPPSFISVEVNGTTISLTASAEPAGPTAYTLAESTQGMIVGTNGMAYDVADKDNLPSGVTAAGVVVYKNGANGLAIALTDEASMMDWATACGESGAAAHTPTVEGQTWKLPSQEEWTLVKNANSGSSLNSAITNAGGTAIPTVHFDHETGTTTGKYWLSTEGGFAEAARTWGINGYDEIAVDSQDFKTSNNLVRACLAW